MSENRAYRKLKVNAALKAEGVEHRLQPCQGADCSVIFSRPKAEWWKTRCITCYLSENDEYCWITD